ncbi:hypothetical protein FS595_20790 [Serratia rubidaea]|nr:hypothetical protein FS596_20785 [Serratia rubidaea]UJD86578.1 hypothetical protein FS595_20790 [Serratia rubidaea]
MHLSVRKFEYGNQINWLTICRPDAYHLYPSYFERQRRWLRSVPRITDPGQRSGIPSFAAFLPLELFRIYRLKLESPLP